MEMTDRYTAWLLALAERDLLVLQVAFIAVCIMGIYWLTVRGSARAWLWIAGFVGVFYASLAGYILLGIG